MPKDINSVEITRLFVQVTLTFLIAGLAAFKIFSAPAASEGTRIFWEILVTTLMWWMPSPLINNKNMFHSQGFEDYDQ